MEIVLLTASFLVFSFVFFMLGRELETTVIVSEPIASNDLVIHSPQIFENLFRDLLTVVINNQEQQTAQFQILQSQIDFIHNIVFYSVVGFSSIVIFGLSYYFLSNNPNINVGEIGNNIYTQVNNQIANISNQIYQVFNKAFTFNNLEAPVAQAELIDYNVRNLDDRYIEIIVENVVDNVQNAEIERLLNVILDERVIHFMTNPANIDLANAQIIGHFLANNGVI